MLCIKSPSTTCLAKWRAIECSNDGLGSGCDVLLRTAGNIALSNASSMIFRPRRRCRGGGSRSWRRPSPSWCSPWWPPGPWRGSAGSWGRTPSRGWRRPSWWRQPRPGSRRAAETWTRSSLLKWWWRRCCWLCLQWCLQWWWQGGC